MIVIKGEVIDAVCYVDDMDKETRNQIKVLADQKFMKGCKLRIMPDCHAGAGCVIGTTMTINNCIVPNLVGVDIGCGMLTVKLGKLNIDLEKLDDFIHSNIPAGMNANQNITLGDVKIEDLYCYDKLKNITYLKQSLGTLGGGNHFIEIDSNDKNELYLVIHSGSRNLGFQVAKVYQNIAVEEQEKNIIDKKKMIAEVIINYKKLGKEKMIQGEINRIISLNIDLPIPRELAYLEGEYYNKYLHDMDICQKFASENRNEIARRIVNHLGLDFEALDKFETIHNYINMNDMILRKGAISAYKGEMVLIPLNMRDGSIIAKGKGNSEFNYSAPHGAGRVLSRKMASNNITIEMFVKAMEGIYSSTVCERTLDESPFAYKNKESIINNITDTVDIIELIKPIYNFKAVE